MIDHVDADRIVEVRIEGFRCIEKARLVLSGLTVLVGDNGSGKSTVLEALEILRRAASPALFDDFHKVHGGLGSTLRHAASELSLGVRVEGGGVPMDYGFALGRDGHRTVITHESLEVGPLPGFDSPLKVIERDRTAARVFDQKLRRLVPLPDLQSDRLVAASGGVLPPQESLPRLVAALSNIQVHVAFDVLPRWASQALGYHSPTRSPQLLEPADRLTLSGENLASAFATLRNERREPHWAETMELVRLGLGRQVRSVNTRVDASGGSIAVALDIDGVAKPLPAAALSDGTLAYLCFVAMVRLGEGRTLLAWDEPELHLHPSLLMRVLDACEALAAQHPVVLATHSDRLLDGLADPAGSVVVCELDDTTTAHQRRLDAVELQAWLQSYRGLGSIRAEGYQELVMEPRRATATSCVRAGRTSR